MSTHIKPCARSDTFFLFESLRNLKGEQPVHVLVKVHVFLIDGVVIPDDPFVTKKTNSLISNFAQVSATLIQYFVVIDRWQTNLMKVTRFRRTEWIASSSQVVFSGQYMMYIFVDESSCPGGTAT